MKSGLRFSTIRMTLLVTAFVMLMLMFSLKSYSGADSDVASRPFFSGVLPGVLLQCTGETGGQPEIRLWHNKTDGAYYLFLPSGAAHISKQWKLNSATRLIVDGQEITGGDKVNLPAGIYEMETEIDGQKIRSMLAVMYSANTQSVFIETKNRSTAWLHEDRAHTAEGSFFMLRENGGLKHFGDLEQIRCRGNVSFEEVPQTGKKSYALKLAQKADLLGGGRAKNYVLVSNVFDASLLRNATADALAHATGVLFSVRETYVDLYLNCEYAGSYLLTDKIEIDDNRIGIRDLEKETKKRNPDFVWDSAESFMIREGRLYSMKGFLVPQETTDISGGYLLEMELIDRYGLEKSGFITSGMQAYVIKSPQYASYPQVSYLAGRIQDMEDALDAPDGVSPFTGRHYAEYLDQDSFARHYIIEELSKNLDSASTSQFFFKPQDRMSTLFYAGPCWDHDKAFGLYGAMHEGLEYDGYNIGSPEGLFAGAERTDYNLWYALCTHDAFMRTVSGIYRRDTYPAACEIADKRIPETAEMLADSFVMNAVRWGNGICPDGNMEELKKNYRDSALEVASFLRRRADWLLEEWGE